jgi:AraC-like DNA-binding protein
MITSDLVCILRELVGPALDAVTLLENLLTVPEHDPGRASRIESIVRDHLGRLSRNTLVRSAQARRVLRYIDDHLNEPLTVRTLVKVTGFSRSQLAAMAYAHAGMSVREYVRMQRIRRAVAMLLRSEKACVAMVQVGYHNKTSFNRAFKQVTGAMPHDFLGVHAGPAGQPARHVQRDGVRNGVRRGGDGSQGS